MDIKEFLIDENKTMLEAMNQLDVVSKKILFVTKENDFVAALTDGDIRRWILKKGSLEAKVKDVANYNPKYLFEEEKNQSKKIMKLYSLEALPIVDKDKNIVSILMRDEERIEYRPKLNIPVVIMAGGLGTRLYPFTKILPKPLIPIGEIPIIEHIINRFNDFGNDQFYLIVNHKKNMIKAYFNEIERNYHINYIDEDTPLGTGGGLSLLKDKIDSTFILSNCDILIKENFEKIYRFHKEHKNLITMICSLKNIKIPYGVIEIDEVGKIESMKEKPELSFFTNTGMYFVEPRVINEIDDNIEIGFPEIIENFRIKGEKIGVYPISENNWMDMGQFEEMDEMRRRLEKDE